MSRPQQLSRKVLVPLLSTRSRLSPILCTCARPTAFARTLFPISARPFSSTPLAREEKLPRPDEHNAGDEGLQGLRTSATEVSTEVYHSVSEETMDTLTDTFEDLIENLALAGNADAKAYDVEYSSGVLTLNLGDKGTYVINKQPPNKQIWLSSPVSGPKRYDLNASTSTWYYSRDGTTLKGLLEKELKDLLDTEVEVDISGGE